MVSEGIPFLLSLSTKKSRGVTVKDFEGKETRESMEEIICYSNLVLYPVGIIFFLVHLVLVYQESQIII